MWISILITIPVLAAAVIILAVAGTTKLFRAYRPSGHDALIVPVLMLAEGFGWLLTLLAAWGCMTRGGLDWVSTRPLVPGAAAAGVVVGVAVLALTPIGLWGGRTRRGLWPVLAAAGVVVPLVLMGLLLACAWMDPGRLAAARWPRIVGAGLVGAAVIGALFGVRIAIWALGEWARAARRSRGRRMIEAAEAAERAREFALPRPEQVGRKMAAMPAGAPLWSITGSLATEEDEACAGIIMARAMKVEELDRQVIETLSSTHIALRAGALEFVRRSRDRKPEWAEGVSVAMERLAKDIRRAKGMKSPRYGDEYAVEVQRVVTVARVFPAVDFSVPMRALRAAVEGEPECQAKAQAMKVLTAGVSGGV
jgi:hypothetical protein